MMMMMIASAMVVSNVSIHAALVIATGSSTADRARATVAGVLQVLWIGGCGSAVVIIYHG